VRRRPDRHARQSHPTGRAAQARHPYILIATFRSDDRLLGVQAADEVRKRVASEHSAQELFVVTKHNINTTLEASGYRADSALNAVGSHGAVEAAAW
jgi:hypothetical protein